VRLFNQTIYLCEYNSITKHTDETNKYIFIWILVKLFIMHMTRIHWILTTLTNTCSTSDALNIDLGHFHVFHAHYSGLSYRWHSYFTSTFFLPRWWHFL